MYQESSFKFHSRIQAGIKAAINNESVYNRSKIVREECVAVFPSTSRYEHRNGEFAIAHQEALAAFLRATGGAR
jgi:hypothetical protein